MSDHNQYCNTNNMFNEVENDKTTTTTLKKVMKVTVDSATFVISSFVIKVPYPWPINIPANIKSSSHYFAVSNLSE